MSIKNVTRSTDEYLHEKIFLPNFIPIQFETTKL